MRSVGGTCRTKPKLTALCALAIIASVALVGCGNGDTPTAATSRPGPSAGPIARDDPSGVVAGLVLKEPISLDEARSLGAELGGDLIALYRTDYACVQPITGGMLDWEPEPSRFTYVDASKIRERRVAAVEAGLSPPITGWLIAESYWEHWEDQRTRAKEPRVRFEAMAIYLPEDALAAAGTDTRFRAAEVIPHSRTDSLSPDYPGELLLESENFLPGILTEPPPIDCSP